MLRFVLISCLAVLSGTGAYGAGISIGIGGEIGIGGGNGGGIGGVVVADWQAFKAKYNKVYKDAAEDAYRMSIYMEKIVEINAHNSDPTKTYTKGINRFSDLTLDEFRAHYTGGVVPANWTNPGSVYSKTISTRQAASVDWRNNNAVTPVKDQGSCASCWAFSATGAIEGAYAVAHGQLNSLSEEFLVDCDTADGNEGCSGGWPYRAMTYVQNYPGIPTESQYPYTASNGYAGTCQNPAVSSLSGVTVTGQTNNGGSESTLESMVSSLGPVSVCVDAAHGCNWQSYTGGIFNEACYQYTDHCVLAVGYSQSNYWILKNQWGTDFGENGYIRIGFGSNICGVADYGTYPYVN